MCQKRGKVPQFSSHFKTRMVTQNVHITRKTPKLPTTILTWAMPWRPLSDHGNRNRRSRRRAWSTTSKRDDISATIGKITIGKNRKKYEFYSESCIIRKSYELLCPKVGRTAKKPFTKLCDPLEISPRGTACNRRKWRIGLPCIFLTKVFIAHP